MSGKLFLTAALGLVASLGTLHGAESKPAPDLAALPAPASGAVDFAKDIQPLLEKNCYSCHGPEKHKGGLRLDNQAGAMVGGDEGKVILPGKSAESSLIHLVAGLDAEKVMPPKGERLSTEQIAKLRAWIDAGAQWPEAATAGTAAKVEHWAFKAPVRQAPPKVKDAKWVRNPVDNFVLARLEKEKIKPSPEADRTTLIRRLSLDLLGLPPTPEEVAAFVTDKRSDAYERQVDRLLASPHFGERWGRHWLDLARYADSDGYEKDSARPYAYIFRDWVINAINKDLPFDEFTIEQLAGDLLPNATEEQKTATAFHRQTLTNREGGVDKEEFRCKATVDRVSTTGAVWLGLTVGCAECHTHKYDPITQREFYQFYAFFNNASEKDIPSPRPVELAEYNVELKAWEAKLAELEKPLDEYLATKLQEKMGAWEQTLKLPAARWTSLKPKKVSVANEGDETQITAAKDNSISPRAKDPVRSRFSVEADPGAGEITGFRVEAIAEPGKSVGRSAKGSFALSEFFVLAQTGDGEPQRLKLASAQADYADKDGDAGKAIDGDRDTGWTVSGKTEETHVIVFSTEKPLTFPKGTKLTFKLEHFTVGLMNRFRISTTTSSQPLEASPMPDAVLAILDTPGAKRTDAQKNSLARYYAEQDSEAQKLNKVVAAHKAKKPKYPETAAAVLVADERKTQVHIRGDFLRKGDEVTPNTLAVLHPFKPRTDKPDRLDLAKWLVDPANPLTTRVTVNHVWKNLFSRALVASVNDFGTRGDKPTHPELLDWLATELPRLGWSRKALIKLIVSSATYRQSSVTRPELNTRDPNNLLLARQNRYRLDAENVRDIYLSACGLLNPNIGGPSIHPKLPADIAALGYANGVKWKESSGDEMYRRGMYIFFQRTVPYPMLMTFDAPDSNATCTRRERSNTPLQALTLLNDPVFFECAQALGKRAFQEPGATDERIKRVFQRCLSRDPTKAELTRLSQLYSGQMGLLNGKADNAAKIAGEKKADAADVDEKATMVALARVIMNLDEFVTRE